MPSEQMLALQALISRRRQLIEMLTMEKNRRLRASGKPAKVALTACMRKLLTIINVMLKERRARNPQLAAVA